MPHYYGLDYGSTTSLLYEYTNGKPQKLSTTQSATKVFNGSIVQYGEAVWDARKQGFLVESPKREFIVDHKKVFDGVECTSMIANTIVAMLSGQEQEIQNCHITLTVPNGYTAADYIAMHDIVLRAIGMLTPNAIESVKIHLLPEPVAAALHYIHCCMKGSGNFENRHFVICDIGGGTTDISIVTCTRLGRNLSFKIEPNQQADKKLGGNDFSSRLCRHLGIDSRKASVQSKNAIQILKHRLSDHEEETVTIDNYSYTCTRVEFEECIGKELERLGELMKRLRDKCGLTIDSNWVILRVGGSCRIPAVQKLLQNKFPEIKQAFDTESGDIFYSVAQGAAIYSAYCANALTNEYNTIKIDNATPHKISYKTADGEWKTIVPQNSPDGLHPSPVLQLIGGEADKETYSVGDIMIWEESAPEPMIWPQNKGKRFKLGNRNIKDVRLKLSIKIMNSRIHSCIITDIQTQENDCWAIDSQAKQ